VPGLMFAGASTVPGSGVPLVLISGRLAAQRVEAYARETSIVRW
jgi:phytoene desaturase